jgi:hypothetical protein
MLDEKRIIIRKRNLKKCKNTPKPNEKKFILLGRSDGRFLGRNLAEFLKEDAITLTRSIADYIAGQQNNIGREESRCLDVTSTHVLSTVTFKPT